MNVTGGIFYTPQKQPLPMEGAKKEWRTNEVKDQATVEQQRMGEEKTMLMWSVKLRSKRKQDMTQSQIL